jgi:hypothetical protein
MKIVVLIVRSLLGPVPLAAILARFPRCLQFAIPLGLDLVLIPGEHVLRRDVSDGAAQTNVVGSYSNVSALGHGPPSNP